MWVSGGCKRQGYLAALLERVAPDFPLTATVKQESCEGWRNYALALARRMRTVREDYGQDRATEATAGGCCPGIILRISLVNCSVVCINGICAELFPSG